MTPEAGPAPARAAVVVLFPAVAAASMTGAIFDGVMPRVSAVLAALLGGLLALALGRVRSTVWLAAGVAGGLFVAGVLPAIALRGPRVLFDLTSLLQEAVGQARLVRPGVALTPGFAALLGWISAGAGFAAVWCAVVAGRVALGLLLPVPVLAAAAISVPRSHQAYDAGVALALLGMGLALLSSGQDERRPLGYEIRRAARALPMLAVVTTALVVLALNSSFLFPAPVIDPAHRAQQPRTASLSAARDRVLFEVSSAVTGPWVIGALDVYNGKDWLLPPLGEGALEDVPSDGVVNRSLAAGVSATFTLREITGAVLPVLPNTVGIQAAGPKLAYSARSGNIRLVEGELASGLSYRVAAAAAPGVDDVRAVSGVPAAYERHTQMPPMPAAVRALVDAAPRTSAWDTFDALRGHVLREITATGLGTPVSITPQRAERILGETKEASPFEIVALQAMLARWAGLPARVGYGFDGGEQSGDHLEVRPRHGAVFPEVYFEGYGWQPIQGRPQRAKVSGDTDPRFRQVTPDVLPSTDIAVPLFLPVELPADRDLAGTVRRWALAAVAALALAAALYTLYPLAVKTVRRGRRRARARASGPVERIVQAYAEWRDLLTDLGYAYTGDTPLMLLERFPDDDEHTELAWLVTRALWGDLQGAVDDGTAQDAEELARALRRRVLEAHTLGARASAALSRASMRDPHYVDPGRRTRAAA